MIVVEAERDFGPLMVSGKDTLMKLRDRMLWTVLVAAAGFSGCAVCDTCDDFPAPCVGPNCGQNGMATSYTGVPVMGVGTPSAPMANDSAGPGPMMPAASMPPGQPMTAPSTPAVNPGTPPSPMETPR